MPSPKCPSKSLDCSLVVLLASRSCSPRPSPPRLRPSMGRTLAHTRPMFSLVTSLLQDRMGRTPACTRPKFYRLPRRSKLIHNIDFCFGRVSGCPSPPQGQHCVDEDLHALAPFCCGQVLRDYVQVWDEYLPALVPSSICYFVVPSFFTILSFALDECQRAPAPSQ